MQVIGASLMRAAVVAVADRASRKDVKEWAERVLFRHIKRTQALMEQVMTIKRLDGIMTAEKLAPDVRDRLREAFDAGEKFWVPSSSLLLPFLQHAADTMDFVESLPDNDRRIRRIDRMGWADAESLSEAWHASLKKAGSKARNLIVGTKRIMEFKEGSYIAELFTKDALAAEGSKMGHCVGGYWKKLAGGSTRIISVRDSAGSPHVTIELSCAPKVRLDTGEELSVDHPPVKGKDVLVQVDHQWVAVQVRGKQNKAPIAKWQDLVDQYFTRTGTPWREFGGPLRTAVGKSFVTFRVGETVSLDPDRAAIAHETTFLEKISAKPDGFREMYQNSGLLAVHKHCRDQSRVQAQAEKYLPFVMQGMSLRIQEGSIFQRAFVASGAADVLQRLSLDAGSAREAKQKVLDLAISSDVPSAMTTTTSLLTMKGQFPVELHQHELPLLSLMLLSLGTISGMEDDVADLVRPALLSTLTHMRANPGALHTVAAAVGGIEEGDVVRAYLLCGLAAEYGAAVMAVEAGVRNKVKEMRLAVRRERTKPGANAGDLNLINNILSDGYEKRLRELARKNGKSGGMTVAPAPAPPVRAIPRHVSEPILKQYRMPGR